MGDQGAEVRATGVIRPEVVRVIQEMQDVDVTPSWQRIKADESRPARMSPSDMVDHKEFIQLLNRLRGGRVEQEIQQSIVERVPDDIFNAPVRFASAGIRELLNELPSGIEKPASFLTVAERGMIITELNKAAARNPSVIERLQDSPESIGLEAKPTTTQSAVKGVFSGGLRRAFGGLTTGVLK
jgi:hypothetical protein